MSDATDEKNPHGDGWLTPREYAKLTPRERRKLQDEREKTRRERYAKATAQGVADDYYTALAGMPPEGGRHAYVWNVVRVKAKRAERVLGLTCAQFVADCQGAPNGHGLTDAELRHIWDGKPSDPVEAVDVDAVAAGSVARRSAPKAEPPKPQPWEREPTDREREGVAELVAVGEKLAASARGEGAKLWPLLRSCSRVAIPSGCGGQAGALVRTLARIAAKLGVKGGGKWYAGNLCDSKAALDAPNPTHTADELAKLWTVDGKAVPRQLTMNPHTGEGVETVDKETGKHWKSYRLKATAAACLFALVEFDEMPLAKQAAFWLGVLATGALDVAAIVFSAHKSLHGIVRVPRTGAGPLGSKANWDAAWGKAKKRPGGDGWNVEKWGPLSRLLMSSRDPAEQVDFDAASNYGGMFRLAGHLRTDKVETPTVQALLWLDAVEERKAEPEPSAVESKTPAAEPSVEAVDDPGGKVEPEPSASAAVADGATLARRCADCPAATVAVCRRAFGKFWLERSRSGVGCMNPVDDVAEDWKRNGPRVEAMRAEARARVPPLPPDVKAMLARIDAAHDPALDYTRRYVECTHIIPDWLARRFRVR